MPFNGGTGQAPSELQWLEDLQLQISPRKAACMQIAWEALVPLFPASQTIWLLARTPAGRMQASGQTGEKPGLWGRQLWGSSPSLKPPTPHVSSSADIPSAAHAGKKDSDPARICYEIGNAKKHHSFPFNSCLFSYVLFLPSGASSLQSPWAE